MRKINALHFILMLWIGIICNSANAQWIQQSLGYEVPGIGVVPTQLVVIDSNTLWGVLTNYYIGGVQLFAKTTNGGANWQIGSISGYPEYNANSISAVDVNTAWVFMRHNTTSDCVLLRTTDGGQNWQELNNTFYPSVVTHLFHFFDQNKGLATGYNSQVHAIRFYTTEDGGDTWTCYDSSLVLNQYQINEHICGHFNVKDSLVKCISTCGRIFTSSDWGKHWTASWTPFSYVNPSVMLRLVLKPTLQQGIMYDNIGPAYETFDGGSTWTLITQNGFDNVIQFAWIPCTSNSCIRLNDWGESCWFSTDGGHTWTEYPELQGKQLRATAWYDNHTGWIAEVTYDPQPSATGMFRFGGEFVGLPEPGITSPTFKVFPNPCTDKVMITIVNQSVRPVSFEWQSLSGYEVAVKQNSQGSVNDSHSFDVSCLAPGVYLLSVITGNQILRTKIIVANRL